MPTKILVTYASRFGATAGVADAVGETLRALGEQVDVLPMKEVSDLSPYRAVVAGSAINGNAWLPEAMQFVQSQRTPLSRRPFAAFLVCITLSMKNADQYRANVSTWLDPVRALVKPMSVGMFAGKLEISKIPTFKERLGFRTSVLLGFMKEGDHRDWNAIRAWAKEIKPKLSA